MVQVQVVGECSITFVTRYTVPVSISNMPSIGLFVGPLEALTAFFANVTPLTITKVVEVDFFGLMDFFEMVVKCSLRLVLLATVGTLQARCLLFITGSAIVVIASFIR